MTTRVWFHANCCDGFTAAWAAHLNLGLRGVEYVPVTHGENVPECYRGDHIYILDFSYPKNVLDKLVAKGVEVLVIDHHLTAHKTLADCPYALIDMTKSGGRLAWEFFHPNQEIPPIVQYTEDRDLWYWSLDNSPQINEYIRSQPKTFNSWSRVNDELKRSRCRGTPLEIGQLLFKQKEEQIKYALARHFVVGNAVVCNSTVHASEIGNCLLTELDSIDGAKNMFAAVFHFVGPNRIKWSLRSCMGRPDVAAIAEKFGGGGHRNAAGCETRTFDEFFEALRK